MFHSRLACTLLPVAMSGVLFIPGGSHGQEPGIGVPVDPAEKRFTELDVNKDGRLSREESAGGSGRLGRVFDQYDTNKDDVIDLDEYKVYYAAANGLPPPPDAGSKVEPKPVVYRYGHLPKGLPAYFTDGDTDQDGQIGLYEWVKYWGTSEAKLAEFKTLDLNDDGILTVEEFLRVQKVAAAALAKAGGGKGGEVSTAGGQPPVTRPPTPPSPGAVVEQPKKDDRRPGGESLRPGGTGKRPDGGGAGGVGGQRSGGGLNPFNPGK